MSDIKLNEEQIETLKLFYVEGYRYLVRTRTIFDKQALIAFKKKPWKNKGNYVDGSVSKGFHCKGFDFVKKEEPFYFGDMFEVVYKGNK